MKVIASSPATTSHRAANQKLRNCQRQCVASQVPRTLSRVA